MAIWGEGLDGLMVERLRLDVVVLSDGLRTSKDTVLMVLNHWNLVLTFLREHVEVTTVLVVVHVGLLVIHWVLLTDLVVNTYQRWSKNAIVLNLFTSTSNGPYTVRSGLFANWTVKANDTFINGVNSLVFVCACFIKLLIIPHVSQLIQSIIRWYRIRCWFCKSWCF